jgi:hyaluronate lyase
MSNLTIHKYEAINGENYKGWYHGDGMIYIYTDGYDFGGDFFLQADPYRMPGVTLNTASRKPAAITSFPNSSNYAGGATQGKYGAVGYILGYTTATSNTFYNTNDSKIGAYKSYFMFDNEIVCVGSNITDKSGKNVITVLENRIWRENDVLHIDGVLQSNVTATETEINARTMHFTNMGGYVFLRSDGKSNNDNNVIKYRKNNGFFELIFDHGKGNTSNGALVNNKYAYSYLPEATSEETELYAADPDAFLIAYQPTTHAVLEKKLGIVAANFFEDGTNAAVLIKGTNTQYTALTELEAETPASIIVSKGENGEYVISISDPTQLYRQTVVTATFTGITELVSADSGAKVEIEDGVVYITINTANACGKTFNITVK